MSNKKRIAFGIIMSVVLFAAMLIGGCGKNLPVAPGNQENDYEQRFNSQSIEETWGAVRYINPVPRKAELIDENGGIVYLDITGYASELEIPAEALNGSVQINCAAFVYNISSGRVYIYDFGPDGLQFGKSAILKLEMAALSDYCSNPKGYLGAELWWYNPDGGEWVLREFDNDVDGDGIVEFKIDHFSRYGIGGRNP
jgi:hypothetical protein